ncbi:hypothetical protein [Actinomadura macra]|uniref:hypothetical protein n=1 Tax=Actinomadura macra TaxID=46164 RepID=UPI00157E15AE|nr:hypothetical protein [Actinomadura macra]
MLSALSLTLVACGSKSTTAYCVDRSASAIGKTQGGYKVVSDGLCNPNDIDSGHTSSYNRYFWYYGGKRDSAGFATGGSSFRPSKGKIKSGSGHTLSRGGFGGGGRSGS